MKKKIENEVLNKITLTQDLSVQRFVSWLMCSEFRSLSAAGLFKYVWPFCYHQVLKG